MALAQNRIYVEYSNDCMDRLEYKLTSQTYQGSIIHYYASSSPSLKLILEMRKGGGKKLAGKPSYLIPCHKIQFNESFMRKCNTGETDIYIVKRDKNGYSAHYVESISFFKDNGTNVSYNSFTYGFTYQKNSIIDPGANLASNKNYNDVMFRGVTGLNCMDIYTFRKSTKNTCATHTDVTFSPNLGVFRVTEIENSLFSKTGADEAISSLDLLRINNLPVDNYVNSVCQGNKPKDPTLYVAPPTIVPDEFTSRGYEITPVIAPKPTPAKPAVKPAKAKVTIDSEFGEPTAPLKNYVVECNAYKRAGYHIVKPKENLYAISRMTGIPVSNLTAWNNISNKELIPACSELRLIPPTPDMYEALEEKKIVSKKAEEEAKAKKIAAAKKKAKLDKITKAKAMAQLRAKHLAELKAKKAAEAQAAKNTGDDLGDKGDAKNVNKKPSEEATILENIHIVQDGETLYTIAKAYGFTSEKFMEINGLTSDIISPQMRLKTTDCACALPEDYTPKGVIPESYDATTKIIKEASIVHQLKSGETLYQISKKYGVSVDRIMLLNNIKDPTDLSVGQDLKIK